MKRHLPYTSTQDLSTIYDGCWYAVMPSVYNGGAYMVVRMNREGAAEYCEGITYGTLKEMVARIKHIRAGGAPSALEVIK